MAHIRVESTDVLAINSRIFYVDGEGNETEISDACRGVGLTMNVGEATTAKLDMFAVPGNVRAELVEVAATELRLSRPGWWRRLKEATSFSDRYRRYV